MGPRTNGCALSRALHPYIQICRSPLYLVANWFLVCPLLMTNLAVTTSWTKHTWFSSVRLPASAKNSLLSVRSMASFTLPVMDTSQFYSHTILPVSNRASCSNVSKLESRIVVRKLSTCPLLTPSPTGTGWQRTWFDKLFWMLTFIWTHWRWGVDIIHNSAWNER